jgi:tripartite-type tricarboxylate transporter receptor subunit TctC
MSTVTYFSRRANFSRRILAGAIGMMGLIAGTWAPALAQTNVPASTPAGPTRVVKFIIPFGAGAGADIGARLVAERLQNKWGKAVII